MPKKSTAARQANAARRSQTAAKSQNVALVRVPSNGGASATPDVAVTHTERAPRSATVKPSAKNVSTTPATRPAANAPKAATTADRPATSARPAAKPTPAKPTPAKPASAPQPQSTYATREQEKRVARAKEMRRVRQASVVTAEHYRYVIRDLRMTGILAAAMFTVIIVLHFVLG